jgi:hypothetical protein
MLIDPIQRMIKRRVEREIFAVIVQQAGYDSAKAAVRLNWGSPDEPEMLMADLISAATSPVPLIRAEEFRKNAIKAGWQLWDPDPATDAKIPSAGISNQGNSGGNGGG